jgi:hypothetical protein
MGRERAVRAAVSLLLLAACASAGDRRSAARSAGAPPGPRYLLVEAPWGCEGGGPDLTAAIESERRRITESMRVAPLRADRRGEIEEALGARDSRPLVLVYLGHATNASSPPGRPPRTRLCLRDGPVAVDDLLKRVSGETPYVFLLLDACWTADVDVRASPAPAAVLSASPDEVETTLRGETALAGLLAPALACADADRDGWIDDRELLDALVSQVGQPVLGVTPIPRLRRQARRALPVFAAPGSQGCPEKAPRPPDPAPSEGVETVWAWSRLGHHPVQSRVVVLWHPGLVEDPVVTDRGRRIRGALLRPTWCTRQSFGQCFEVLPNAKVKSPP